MRVDPNYVSNLVTSLNQNQDATNRLSGELSSGVRVNSLSDDPVAAGQNVALLNQISQDDSFTQSGHLVTGQLQVADSALGSVISELTTAITLATQANNGTLNPSNVQSISSQISGIRDEVQSLANSVYQGQYIFAGSFTDTAPFSTETDSKPSVTTYNGNTNINYLATPAGQKIQLNVPGSTIFLGSGTNSVFAALNSLVNDYADGTVFTDQAVADTSALSTALNYVSQVRVTIGNSINQVKAASDAAANEDIQLTGTQTGLMQADTATVASQLSLAETKQAALESVIAMLDQKSNDLFSKISA
jgi:flagellar hook-associated protein 3 FlgL